ncbi:MAG: polysaccharide deacetylase family protein, partial [Firmicutes bacterium]|nr:polysaccharide deacetylase family protein [Bacillota bacterium]
MRLNQSGFARSRRREIAFSAVCFLLLLGLVSVLPDWAEKQTVRASSSAVNWGLSFPEQGKTPVGNAAQDYLQQYDAYYVGDCSQPVIYLTFDAGFENGCTGRILDVLQQHQAPAAFFLVGSYIRDHADLVQRMVAEGHIVGNHTNTHPDMSAISEQAAFQAELAAVEQAYQDLIGQEMPKFYRPPQGKYSEDNLQQAQQLGYKTVFWSLAYVDWYENDQPSKQEAFDKLLPRVHPGAIVLLHSTSATNADILDELLTKWEDMGYTFKSLDELPE